MDSRTHLSEVARNKLTRSLHPSGGGALGAWHLLVWLNGLHVWNPKAHAPMRSGRAAATRAHALHTLAHRHAHARRVRRTPGCHDSGCRAALGGRGVQPRTAPRGLRRACWMRSTRRGQGALSRGDTQVSTFRQRRTQPPWRPRTGVPAPTPWGRGPQRCRGCPLSPAFCLRGSLRARA